MKNAMIGTKFPKLVSIILILMMAVPLTLIPSVASAVDTGFKDGSIFASVSFAGSDSTWTNPNLAQTSNDNRAKTTLADEDDVTDYLKATGFGFTIPADSIIDGIEVSMEKSYAGTGGNSKVRDNIVKLVKNDNIVGSDKSSNSQWSSTDEYKTYGGLNDKWGETWSVDDINNANFGVVLSAKMTNDDNNREVRVDHIKIKVHYSAVSKVNICHSTGSENNPWVAIRVDANGWNGHSDHENDFLYAGPVNPQNNQPTDDGWCENNSPEEDLPTGKIHITKYECPVGTNLTRNANGPALDGSHTAPEDCDTKSGAYFSYENSNPGTYPGLDGSYLPIPGYSFPEVMGATDANGVLEATVPYLPGKAFNVAETNSVGVILPSVLGLYCNGDTDTSKNDNYEQIPSVGEGATKYCVAYNEKVEEPEEPTATIIASKIICPSESMLPNWGDYGPDITSATVSDFLLANPSCNLESNWDFQWVLDSESSVNPGNNILTPAESPWTTFSTSAIVPVGEKVWVREVLKDGYINFTGQNTTENVSAEIYCHTDVLNYDNWDFVENTIEEETYYCVAFNAPAEEPLICNPNVNLIENGDFETPVVTDETNKWQIFSSGIGWMVDWIDPLVFATPSLEFHRGVNGWSPSEGMQYVELDGDTEGPGGQNGESASTMIWQDIPTIPGKNYKLTFDFSPRPNKGNTENVLGVSWGGVSEDPISAVGGSQTNWTPYTFNFTATTSLTTLMFKDLGISNSEGTFLDNVSLTCQNEPTNPCTYADEVFYSDTNHMIGEANAVETWTHANWVSTTSPAKWIWKDLNVQNPTGDEMYTFTKTFNLTGVPTSDAVLSFAADNSYRVVINGYEIASTTNEYNFGNFVDLPVPTSALVYGVNTIEVTVHNFAQNLQNTDYTTNPAGFIYALYVNTEHCLGDNPHEPDTLQVKIYKYLDGKIATEVSAGGYSFPMQSSWSWAGNQSSGQYTLNPNGYNSAEPYSAYTSVMTAPAIYNTFELTNTESGILPQGIACVPGRYKLVGYKVGGTLSEAENSDLMTTNPSLTNLNSDTYIIVYNETCPEDQIKPEVQPEITTTAAPTSSSIPGGRRRDVSGLFGGAGQVLGASTEDLMCEPYLKEYIKLGGNNNPEEVKKLQIFLNQFFELNNPVTGFYGPLTFEMVKKFQTHQEAATLTPWLNAGVPTDGPTGYVYKTTKRWINILKCPEMLASTPVPSLP